MVRFINRMGNHMISFDHRRFAHILLDVPFKYNFFFVFINIIPKDVPKRWAYRWRTPDLLFLRLWNNIIFILLLGIPFFRALHLLPMSIFFQAFFAFDYSLAWKKWRKKYAVWANTWMVEWIVWSFFQNHRIFLKRISICVLLIKLK